MSDSNYRSSGGGAPRRGRHSLPPRLPTRDIRRNDAAVASNAWPPVSRTSASQGGVNSSGSGRYRHNPYGPLCVQEWDLDSQSHWSAYTRSHNDPVAYSNDSQWHSSDGGGGWALSEARYPDDGYSNAKGTLPNQAQVPHHQAHGLLTIGAGRSQDRGSFPEKNDGFDGTPHEFPAVRRVQTGSRPTDDDGNRHTTPQPTTVNHHHDSPVSHVARKRRRSIQSRHASQGAPQQKPSKHSCQKHDVPGEGDTSNEEKTRSPTSGDKGGSHGIRASPPPPPHTSPLFDSSKPITGTLIVKCKKEGFRYPTTQPNYRQELPIGTDLVVWRDCAEAIGEVTGYVSNCQMIQDHQRVLNIKENGLTAEAGGLTAVPGDSAFEYSQQRSPSSSTLCTDVGQQPRTSELGREYNRSAAHDVQETLRDIFGDEKKYARVLRKATDEDIATWATRQEEEREKLPGIAETVAKNSRLVTMKGNSTSQLHDDNGSTAYWVEDMEYSFGQSKVTVYLGRKDPIVEINFKVAQRRVYNKYKCRVDIRYLDELADDNDDPAHIERVQEQRRKSEAERRAHNENNGAASPPPS